MVTVRDVERSGTLNGMQLKRERSRARIKNERITVTIYFLKREHERTVKVI
jgi:hypothetical protein